MVLVSLIALFYIASPGEKHTGSAGICAAICGPAASGGQFPGTQAAGSPVAWPPCCPSIMLVLSLAGCLYIVGEQVTSLADDWPQFKQQVLSSVNDLQVWISHKFHIRIKQQMTYVNNATSKLLESGGSVIGDVFVSFSSLLLFLVFILIDTFFLLYYRRLIIRFLVAVFREENSPLSSMTSSRRSSPGSGNISWDLLCWKW
jgi:hypothetical protein